MWIADDWGFSSPIPSIPNQRPAEHLLHGTFREVPASSTPAPHAVRENRAAAPAGRRRQGRSRTRAPDPVLSRRRAYHQATCGLRGRGSPGRSKEGRPSERLPTRRGWHRSPDLPRRGF